MENHFLHIPKVFAAEAAKAVLAEVIEAGPEPSVKTHSAPRKLQKAPHASSPMHPHTALLRAQRPHLAAGDRATTAQPAAPSSRGSKPDPQPGQSGSANTVRFCYLPEHTCSLLFHYIEPFMQHIKQLLPPWKCSYF